MIETSLMRLLAACSGPQPFLMPSLVGVSIECGLGMTEWIR